MGARGHRGERGECASVRVPFFDSKAGAGGVAATVGDAPLSNAPFPTRSSGELEFFHDCTASHSSSVLVHFSSVQAIRFFSFRVVRNFSWARGFLAMSSVVVYLCLYVSCVAGTRSREQTPSRTHGNFDLP